MSKEKEWFLRKSDGEVYGPVSLGDLRRWSVESRVLAGNEISTDKKRWHLIEDLQDLDMNWVAQRPDGLEYGPFNIRASKELHRHDVLPKGTTFTHKSTGETHTLAEVLSELGTSPKGEADDPTPTADETTANPPPGDAPLDASDTSDDAADDSADDSAASQARVDALVAELDRVTVELDGAQAKSEQDLAAQQADHTAALESLQTTLATRAEELTACTAELAELRASGATDLDEARATIAQLQQQLEQDQQALAKAEELHLASQRELTERHDEVTHRLNQAQQQHQAETAELHEELESAQSRSSTLETRLGTLEAEQDSADSQQQQASTELRHQVVFMKKNSANLTTDLEHVRSKLSNLRLTVLAVLGLAALAIMLTVLFNNSGCRQTTAGEETTNGADASPDLPAPPDPPIDDPDLPPARADQPTTPGLAGTPLPVWPTITVPGVRTIPERGTLKLVFLEGLFSSWDNLSAEGKVTLQALAQKLGPLAGDYRLEIEGHTDNQPLRSTERYADNVALGKARAQAVVSFLTAEGGLPAAMLKPTSAGEQRPPHPNSSPEARRRNRTVVFILRRGR